MTRDGGREASGVRWAERLGLTPRQGVWDEVRKAVVGTEGTPGTQWGLSSVRILEPAHRPAHVVGSAPRRRAHTHLQLREPQPPTQGRALLGEGRPLP